MYGCIYTNPVRTASLQLGFTFTRSCVTISQLLIPQSAWSQVLTCHCFNSGRRSDVGAALTMFANTRPRPDSSYDMAHHSKLRPAQYCHCWRTIPDWRPPTPGTLADSCSMCSAGFHNFGSFVRFSAHRRRFL